MSIDLSPEAEGLVDRETRLAGFKVRTSSSVPQSRLFLVSREHSAEENRKLALLRADLEEASAQIDAGDCFELDSDEELGAFFAGIEAEVIDRLGREKSGR